MFPVIPGHAHKSPAEPREDKGVHVCREDRGTGGDSVAYVPFLPNWGTWTGFPPLPQSYFPNGWKHPLIFHHTNPPGPASLPTLFPILHPFLSLASEDISPIRFPLASLTNPPGQGSCRESELFPSLLSLRGTLALHG